MFALENIREERLSAWSIGSLSPRLSPMLRWLSNALHITTADEVSFMDQETSTSVHESSESRSKPRKKSRSKKTRSKQKKKPPKARLRGAIVPFLERWIMKTVRHQDTSQKKPGNQVFAPLPTICALYAVMQALPKKKKQHLRENFTLYMDGVQELRNSVASQPKLLPTAMFSFVKLIVDDDEKTVVSARFMMKLKELTQSDVVLACSPQRMGRFLRAMTGGAIDGPRSSHGCSCIYATAGLRAQWCGKILQFIKILNYSTCVDGDDPLAASKSTLRDRAAHDAIVAAVAHTFDSARSRRVLSEAADGSPPPTPILIEPSLKATPANSSTFTSTYSFRQKHPYVRLKTEAKVLSMHHCEIWEIPVIAAKTAFNLVLIRPRFIGELQRLKTRMTGEDLKDILHELLNTESKKHKILLPIFSIVNEENMLHVWFKNDAKNLQEGVIPPIEAIWNVAKFSISVDGIGVKDLKLEDNPRAPISLWSHHTDEDLWQSHEQLSASIDSSFLFVVTRNGDIPLLAGCYTGNPPAPATAFSIPCPQEIIDKPPPKVLKKPKPKLTKRQKRAEKRRRKRAAKLKRREQMLLQESESREKN
ncbi:hypothetical protein Y032_0334g2827 [Ancylostoma ceylanicum]|uniref:Serpin domain-containing protein n=2 Tax=Ancylostoma ceylanicum TaxID=53326 RepID=A0A016RYV9_9BILA|nr:hypothetical protein Y032_0334g2827 [Ancylostoma ceylanicum]